MRSHILVIVLIVQVSRMAVAQEVAFDQVWGEIKNQSTALEAAKLQAKSGEVAVGRARKHWLPRVYADVKSYSTNDPGANLIGLLEQRKIEPGDFSTNNLNHPSTSTYTRAALGVDLPLYEGGSKSHQSQMYSHLAKSQALEAGQVEVELYGQAGVAYSTVAVIERQLKKLDAVGSDIKKLLKSYQIGQKSNPVGYSGLLGLKSVRLRAESLRDQYSAIKRAGVIALKELGFAKANWQAQDVESVQFVKKYFSAAVANDNGTSYRQSANAERVRATSEMADLEKARNLPRVGAFAETYAFKGERDQANAYVAGVYLQWNIYDPADVGRYKEAKLKADSHGKQSEALLNRDRAEKASAENAIEMMQGNLNLLQESDALLEEQMRVGMSLFRNGSITALQLSEILNRRLDIISQRIELETQLLRSAAEKIGKERFTNALIAQSEGI